MQYALIGVFFLLFTAAHIVAISSVLKYWRLANQGLTRDITTPFGTRVKNVLINAILQKKLLQLSVRGVFHMFIFYGFLVYLLHTSSQIIGGFLGPIEYTDGKNGYDLYIPELINFIIPGFLHAYDYFLDIFTVLVLSGLSFFALRRWVFKAKELDRPSVQSMIVIFMISTLMICTLISEPARAIKDSLSHEGLSPIRVAFINMFYGLGMTESSAENWFLFGWWGHIITVFAFMMFVPSSKHAHLIWAPVNYFFHPDTPKGALPNMDLEAEDAVWGSTNVHEFSWKEHLNGLSCIECGRCTLQCPANRTGKQLNPKKIMTDLKHALMEKMDLVAAARASGSSQEDLAADTNLRVIDNYTSQEELWACTTCYACVEACPVGNNQVESIIGMRRALVLNEGSLPTELQNALGNIETQSNPWGVGSHKRAEWAEGMDIRTMAQWQEAGEKPDILFWVGCAGAFDDRNKKIAQSIVTILNKAQVKFGILGEEEGCTGDSARRAGNEYLFQSLAMSNIEIMKGYDVNKIVTGCPHCFNTLKNEYPQFDGNFDVEHHSTYVEQLVNEGKLKVSADKAADLGNLSYHDSCYLGRYNDNYDSPRNLITKTTGKVPFEPMDHKTTGLCCGAGGAQMWKEEEPGDERVNYKRVDQLVATEANTIVSACPFCMTMISDGVKGQELEESVKTLDIAEVVAGSIDG